MNLRRNLKTVVVSLLAIVTLSACGTGPSSEPAAQPKSVQVRNNYQSEQLNLNVKSAIAIDSKTGQLLYGKNINQVLPIASMTKLVTTYLTLQAIKEQKLSWDNEVKPTKQIVKVANNKQFSNVPLKMGHSYTIRQLYQATLIESANGAAMLLAQAVSGSQVVFVRQMRQQLKKWGINDAQIYTVCGLPNKSVGTDAYPGADKDAENEMSAKDMAIVGQHLLNDFPEIIETTRIAHLNFTDQGSQTLMTNFNWMLKGLSQYQQDLKVDGLKTGTTDAAGACFIGTAKDSDARLITVVMGARHANSL
ncbi:MAG: serine hydrolase, partial [Bombilactobacillus sp.]|nr:serine hydrolase [Bombilactobacillus sp.]